MEDLYFHVLLSVDACYGSSPISSCVASHQFIQLLSALSWSKVLRGSPQPSSPSSQPQPHTPLLPPSPHRSLTPTNTLTSKNPHKQKENVLTPPTLRLTLLRHRLLRPLRLRLLYQLALLIVLGIYLVNFRFR